jgi:hypothetical protein
MKKTIAFIGLVFFFQVFSFGQIEKEINSSIKKVISIPLKIML